MDIAEIRDYIREKVIQNIVIAYIQDYEDINDPRSLIVTLLNRNNLSELQQVIWFLWTLREEEIANLSDKVFALWPKLLEISDIETKEGRKLLSQLSHWTSFIKQIDETNEKWLMQIAPYADEDYNSYHLLEGLANISESQPIEVQKVWLQMITPNTHDYPPDAIKKMLKNIINTGADGERLAKEVVDAYLRQGIERPSIYLKEIKASLNLN